MTSDARLPKTYDPAATEDAIYAFWEEGGWFAPAEEAEGDPFTIIMPPPNVTGALHLGHALTITIEDALIRWHRMLGEPALWLPGLDHAGIATQSVVEQEIAKEGLTRHDLGREEFIERVWTWVGRYRSRIESQTRRMGASCDWDRLVFTLDQTPREAVRKTFADLHRDGKIYRGHRIITWDPQMLTALSDVEVEYEEEEGKLWYVRYPFVDDDGNELDDGITIATTRPETIPADVAVAVHPSDERWQPHLGRLVRLPLRGFERLMPIIADDAIDPEFGTGALKVTPGHDQLDFEIGERHGLETISAIDWDGTLTADTGLYAGMDRDEARELVAEHLREDGYLIKEEAHVHNVAHSQRSGVVVEPLVSNQWFVDTTGLAAEAARVVRDGEIRIVPERSTSVYLQWMENIRPWCISRQLWWGHRIPAWYCLACDGKEIIASLPNEQSGGREPISGTVAELHADGRSLDEIATAAFDVAIGEHVAPIVGYDDPDACPECGSKALIQDPDVLDTWFSSGLWTHSTLGWPNAQGEDLQQFYPSSVMETGYDILFFWVARMIMLGCYNMGRPPFETVYLHGLVRDPLGRKMSKSLNNAIDPLEKAEQFGTDALRFTLATGSSPGNDMRLTDEHLEGARNFANKLWNGARFVLGEAARVQVIEQNRIDPEGRDAPLVRDVVRPDVAEAAKRSPALEDRWIKARLAQITADVDRLLRDFQLGEAGRQIQDFLWGEFFDWYVEASKIRMQRHRLDLPQDYSPMLVLIDVLDNVLRLLHPWMPFITEAIWQKLSMYLDDPAKALIVAKYPSATASDADQEILEQFGVLQELVTAIRQIRADYRLPRSVRPNIWVVADQIAEPLFGESIELLQGLAQVAEVNIVGARDQAPLENVAATVVPHAEVIIPLGGLIDTAQERARLDKELAQIDGRLKGAEAKLANEGFRSKAPAEVVAKAEASAADLRAQRETLLERLASLP